MYQVGCLWKQKTYCDRFAFYFENDTTLIQKMIAISEDSPYKQSKQALKNFLFRCKSENNQEFFPALFLAVKKNKNSSINDIIGFLNLNILLDEVEIDFICIEESHRQKGIGKLLFAYFENFITAEKQKIKSLFLEVSCHNKSAL
ncbi:MAG: GNAT family N-acetyltransferase, partial [Silvanigrellaceae bacterium]|nr:GNAT family N-acetyltransferase [Silvanigrellaceae bacterium]